MLAGKGDAGFRAVARVAEHAGHHDVGDYDIIAPVVRLLLLQVFHL